MPEQQNIEWKESWRDEYLKWICGFANAQGGKIYIGCNDNGEIVGLQNAAKLMEDIPNKIREFLGIVVEVNLLHKDGLDYIEINVPPYPVGISYKGVYHYRSGSTKQLLTGPALESFLLQKRGATWDNLPLPALSMEDLDDGAIAGFKEKAARRGRIDRSLLQEPKEVLMEKLHLCNSGYLTNAAMLLFGKDPERWQLGACIKIGFFETDADLRYQDIISGPVFTQIDRAVELLHLKYMKAYIRYEGLQRIESYFVPEDALREAILNAVCHKQYQSGIPIQISVYEHQMYIANAGRLPENWTLDSLMSKHASKPYNPAIAHVLYLAGFIESWGRGIEKMWRACAEQGEPAPEMTVNPGDIMIRFREREPKDSAPGGGHDSAARGVTKAADKVTYEVTKAADEVTKGVTKEAEPPRKPLSERERQILASLAAAPDMRQRDLSNSLGLSRKTVAAYMSRLKESGWIERAGTRKDGYWIIKRRIE